MTRNPVTKYLSKVNIKEIRTTSMDIILVFIVDLE